MLWHAVCSSVEIHLLGTHAISIDVHLSSQLFGFVLRSPLRCQTFGKADVAQHFVSSSWPASLCRSDCVHGTRFSVMLERKIEQDKSAMLAADWLLLAARTRAHVISLEMQSHRVDVLGCGGVICRFSADAISIRARRETGVGQRGTSNNTNTKTRDMLNLIILCAQTAGRHVYAFVRIKYANEIVFCFPFVRSQCVCSYEPFDTTLNKHARLARPPARRQILGT